VHRCKYVFKQCLALFLYLSGTKYKITTLKPADVLSILSTELDLMMSICCKWLRTQHSTEY